MPLLPGSRLGPYEIVAPIGAGGMGEVYRARDTKLNRDVAIKVLLGGVAHDPERRERFEREAQAIAALNHPSIVTIFGVETAGETSFLAMELVEGKPLSERIPRGGLLLGQLLTIAIPVADAVAAAHQKGITHRDLKPANIMIGSGEHAGRVKVLDFGLAKLTGASPGGEATTGLPTALATGEGRILGTVAYMSPEQAQGKPIDARSDLFSLGVILYELATGSRPFTGDTSISIISSIVKDTPTSLTEINPSTPRDLARIVRRALAKDPEKRYQTAKDLRNDLEELKASLDSGELTAEAAPSGPAAAPRHGGHWRWIAVGAIGVAVIAVGTAAVMMRRGAGATPAASSAAPVTMTPLTSTGTAQLGTISADGKFVAYVQTDDGAPSVWVRQLASGSTVRILAPTPGLAILGMTIAPDASFVDVVRSRTVGQTLPVDLWRVPFLGGQPRKILDDITSAPGWSPDGKEMAYLANAGTERRLMTAHADGSQPRVIATRTVPRRYVTLSLTYRPDLRPVWLPDGRAIAVMGNDDVRAPNQFQVIRVDVATGAETELYAVRQGAWQQMGMAMGRSGTSLVLNLSATEAGPRQVVNVALDTGETTALTNDLAAYTSVSLAGDVIVTTRRQSSSGVWLTDAAGGGAHQFGTDVPTFINGLAWAGTAHLVYVASLVGGSGVWSTSLQDGSSALIVPGGGQVVASADGRTLVFSKSDLELWRAEGDGGHATRLAGATGSGLGLTPDGSRLFYISSQSGEQLGWVADLAGGPPRQFTPMHVDGATAPRVSRDGRMVMYVALGDKALIMPVGGGEPAHEVPGIFGRVRWTPDGRGLAHLDVAEENILVQAIAGGTLRQLTTFTDHKKIRDFAWSPDGRQLAIVRAVSTSDIVLLKGVR